MAEISEGKRKEYALRRKESVAALRASWREARKANDFTGRNMEFFIRIYQNLGINRKRFAAMLGRSQQTIDWWLVSDDVRLGTLQDAFLNMDMRLECRLSIKEGSPLRHPLLIEAGPLQTVFESESGKVDYTLTMPKFVLRPSPAKFGGTAGSITKDARLYFLADVMRECGMRLKPFCLATKTDYVKLFKNLTSDDIFISTIYELAANGGLSVKWSLVPVKAG